VTEHDWLTGVDPDPMLDFLSATASDRKLRLFGCACCRRVWGRITDSRSRAAVGAAERYAEGQLTPAQLRAAMLAGWVASRDDGGIAAAVAAREVASYAGRFAAWYAACAGAPAAGWGPLRAAQASLLRCLLGNPFRPARLDPAWRTRTVQAVAQVIYDEHDFGMVAVLADALEDAGCESAEFLAHCRLPGEHARGCWVVDLVLGKQ
jgi:hypothetical protein